MARADKLEAYIQLKGSNYWYNVKKTVYCDILNQI